VNAKNLYTGAPTTALNTTVTGLPTAGQPIYVTLSSEIGGTWQSIVYTFTEYGSPVSAVLTGPTAGSKLGSSEIFTWSPGSGITKYWFNLGTAADGVNARDLYDSGPITTLTATVTGVPQYGETLYATLYSWISGAWQPIIYSYTAGGSPVPAELTTPTPTSRLSSSSVTFTWTPGGGVTNYWFNLGTADAGANAKNIYSGGSTTATSVTVSNLPTNGETIFATLYSWIDGAWKPTVYTYTCQ
jgi:hypothetical protein